MVMEAPPSPQSVGREFVRQYYTLLNKAPAHLHRFYNHQSSFIHGGLDPPNRETSPVIGQKQIHQKIQQLNFRDCHAKITQVDSQATLGEGVVVQVTGELSNGGQPMRRFTQTFVLASQSPKKYYVHNDIFRYQDEIISDEECDAENRSEPEDDVQNLGGQVPIASYYQPSAAPMQQPPLPPVHHQQAHVLAQAVPTVNGAVHPDEMGVVMPGGAVAVQGQAIIPVVPISGLQQQQGLGQVQQINQQQVGLVEEVGPQVGEVLPVDEGDQDLGYKEQEEGQDAVVEPSAVILGSSSSNEPKTYANLLKSGNTVPNFSPPMASAVLAQPPRSASPPAMNRGDQGGSVMRSNSSRTPRTPLQQQNQRVQKQDSGRIPGRNSFNEDGDDRKRSQGNSFSDTFQLFLGNLPLDATEDELRDIFSKYGTIVDLRVHNKPSKAVGVGGRAPPNYGFITYESPVGVQACLAARPIFYPKEDKNGTQLNVEEKKMKDRPSYGGGGGGRPSNDNRQRDGPRRGPGGGGGMGGGGPRNSAGGPNNGGPGTGVTPNRTGSYNRGGPGGGSGGPPNARGPSSYNSGRR